MSDKKQEFIDYSKACEKLAEIIITNGCEISGGMAIDRFIDSLRDDETPAMSLALAKKCGNYYKEQTNDK